MVAGYHRRQPCPIETGLVAPRRTSSAALPGLDRGPLRHFRTLRSGLVTSISRTFPPVRSHFRDFRTTNVGEGAEAFSPSGTRIVYVAGGELWVVGLDGQNPVQLTQDGGDHPDWGRR